MTDRVGFGKPAGGCDQVVVGLCRRASPLLPPPVSSCCLALRSSLFSVPTLPLHPATSGGSVSLSSPFCSVSASSLGVALLVQLLRFFFLCHCRSLLPSFILWRPNFLRWCRTPFVGCRTPSSGVFSSAGPLQLVLVRWSRSFSATLLSLFCFSDVYGARLVLGFGSSLPPIFDFLPTVLGLQIFLGIDAFATTMLTGS